MIEKIAQKILKWTGMGYLAPFLEGLEHLGRPSSVLFPTELLEQGLAIVLSGLNNTMAVQSNYDWVWPLWIERQKDPDAEAFVPTGINLIKTNVTCRSWTSMGLADSSREAMIDPVGMLTLEPYGWSVFPYLRLDGKNYFPPRLDPGMQACQRLEQGTLPWILTEYNVADSLEWRCEAVALRVRGEEMLSYSHVLRNRSTTALRFQFGLALRPYNPLTIGHINSIGFQDGLWHVNGKPGLLILTPPNRVSLSDRHLGDPLFKETPVTTEKELKSRSGIAAGQSEFDLELAPGETRVIESLGFLGKQNSAAARRLSGLTPATLQTARASRRDALHALESDGLSVRLPDARLQEAFQAVKGRLHVFDDGTHFSPGTFLYHTHWFRDSAYLSLAFENMGWGRLVESKLLAYPRKQTRKGFFRSQDGEWDSNGEAMWTLVNHIRRGGNPALLEKFHASLMKGARWIVKTRGVTRKLPSAHYGLLPPGFSAEHFGPNDHYYWDNFWGLAGLEAARWSALKLGKKKDHAWLGTEVDAYRRDMDASIATALKKHGGLALPGSPYRRVDSSAIGNLVGISPLDVVNVKEPWVAGTLEYLIEHNLREGLFFQKIVHTGLNPYLSVQMARVLLAMGDERWMRILDGLLDHASPTYTWPEAIHPRLGGGCMGDGDHGWSAAEFVNLVRDMLVTERNGALRLGEGIPSRWYRPGLDLEIRGATTFYGTLDYSLRQDLHGAELSWNLIGHAHQDRAQAWFVMPVATGLRPECPCAVEGKAYVVPLNGDIGSLRLRPVDESAVSERESLPEGASRKI